MLRIGLTGGIGSGKSYVARVFAALNVPVYHADLEARRIMEENDTVTKLIIELLGKKAYSNGKLQSEYIASIVFENPELLEQLNEIVHPAVHEDFKTWSENHSTQKYLIEEAAILFESGGYKQMDYTVFVSADEKTRIRRVVERDGIPEEDVMKRIKAQMPVEKKEKMADYVIYNDSGSMILPQIVDLHNIFMNLKRN